VRLSGVQSGRIYLDAALVDHIRMILGCGRIVVPCQFRGTLQLCAQIERIAAAQRSCGTLSEPGRNTIAGEQAAGEVSAGQQLRSVCMDGCL
jgi:hypothetical protein